MSRHSGTFCPFTGVASKVSLTLMPITACPGAGRRPEAGEPRSQPLRLSAARQQRGCGRLGIRVVFVSQLVEDRTWE
jgi:hypothetical protein